jgi:quercetin dioxygenase-like cupin family protein
MVPLHFHHGDEFHLVLSGEWAAQVEGKPDHIMKSGDAQYVERERWHGGKAIGSVPLKVLVGTWEVDRIDLTQAGNWTVKIIVSRTSGEKPIVLDAPVVIELAR